MKFSQYYSEWVVEKPSKVLKQCCPSQAKQFLGHSFTAKWNYLMANNFSVFDLIDNNIFFLV